MAALIRPGQSPKCSPITKPGAIDHEYGDQASLLKFIEWNWGLPPLSSRSRDNLPNPVASKENTYAPENAPAIGDLRGMFNFAHRRNDAPLIIPDGI